VRRQYGALIRVFTMTNSYFAIELAPDRYLGRDGSAVRRYYAKRYTLQSEADGEVKKHPGAVVKPMQPVREFR
jgi:hypothetical protein